MIKIIGILLIVLFAEAKRPDYVGPRDRFWRHHEINKSIIIDGVEKYNILESCIHEGLSKNDMELMKLIPGDRSIGRTILDHPEYLFGNIVLVEIKNAMTPIHMKAIQTLAKCIREHIPTMYENRPMYLEFGLEKDPGLGGNNPTHLAPLLHIFLPDVVDDMYRVLQLAYDTAGWNQLTIRDELRNDNNGPDRIHSHPKPSDLGFRASEHLTYASFPSLGDHTDGHATAYTLNYAFSDPEEYQGGYLYVQDLDGHRTYLKANKYSAFVFLGGNYIHGVTEITKGHREAFSTETWFNPDIPLGTTLWSSTPASMEQYILKCNELGQNRDNGPCNATFSDITANGVKVADNKVGKFEYEEEEEYYNEENDGLDKHREKNRELLSSDTELEFLPVEEEPNFLIPKELSSGEVFPLSFRGSDEQVNDEAYAIGLPPELLVEFQTYIEKSGLLRTARRLIYEEGAYCNQEHCLYELEDNTTWGCMRTRWDKGDMIWIDPANELCFETLISVLRRGNFDVVLDAVGNLFDLDGLMIQGVGPIFLSHFDHDSEYEQIHRDLPGAKGSFYNIVVPLYIPEGGASIYVGNDEDALPVQMRYNVGTLLGAQTRHGTAECDYRDNRDVRLSVAIYLADVNEENQELIASDSTSLWPSIGDIKWFESQSGRFWRSDGSRSMNKDRGRKPLHVKDFLRDCESINKSFCMKDPTGFRLKCPKTCNVYFEDHLYYAHLGKENTISSNNTEKPQDHVAKLVHWLRSEGGFFSEKISTSSVDEKTGNVVRGMFAGTSLKKNEKIITIPADIRFAAMDMCSTTRKLVREYYLRDSSWYEPFITYVFDSFEHHNLPQFWSENGKNVFSKIVGKKLEPQYFGKNTFKHECGYTDGDDEIYETAWAIVITRGWNEVMVPVYDLFNHRNGHWNNVDQINSFHDDEDVTIIATRDIEAGEPLHISYNECNDIDCFGIENSYTLPFILADYGFVEQYPRRFSFEIFENDLVFDLDTSDDNEYHVTWLDHYPTMIDINWLRGHLRRLENLEETLNEGTAELPQHEKSVILEFYHALKTGMEEAIFHAQNHEECSENDVNADVSDICKTESKRYDELHEKSDELDYSEYIASSVDDSRDNQNRVILDGTRSLYQEIVFDIFNDTKNKKSETCLYLSDWLQTCSSFRPHYHEAFVHYPASFLDSVKRVLFIGGGDNMILHEVLKYSSIELVIGIELDQQVVRSSFKNFGAQPHFDRDVVQWWFGDASKTLKMLPQEYHGTFDLVLVDLQTFVVNSLMVTPELSILDVSLLFLRPDGILAQNEDFVTRNKEGFARYTVDLQFQDVPVIGRQFINMGSDSLDFFHKKPKNHDIETVIFDQFSGNNHHLDSWWNLRKGDRFAEKKQEGINKFIQNKMLKGDGMAGAYGVMFVLEIENVTLDLSPSANVLDSVGVALKKSKLDILSSSPLVSIDDESEEFFVLMKEGYLIFRIWPRFNYCAIDFMVWDNFQKREIVQAELMAVLGGTISTFSIVAGGMYNSNVTEKQILDINSEKVSDANLGRSLHTNSAEMESFDFVLKEMIKLVQKKDPVIVVFCPSMTDSCVTTNALHEEDNEMRIFPISGCLGQMVNENLSTRMQTCDAEIHNVLMDIVLNNGKISGVILDKEIEFEMGQIIHRILSDPQNRKKMLEKKYSIIIPGSDPHESWRKAFVEIFRTEIVKFSPAHMAELYVVGSQSRLKLNIFSYNDEKFYLHLQTAIETCERGAEVVIETHAVRDGILSYKPDNSPPKKVYDQDYQSKAADEQWKYQRPLGRQTISQFEAKAPPLPLFPDDEVLANLDYDFGYGHWHSLYVYGKNDDGTYDVGLEEPLHRQWLRKLEKNEGITSSNFLVGETILMQTEDMSWQPGSILKKINDDIYTIQLNDDDGTILNKHRRELLKFNEVPNDANKPKISLFQLKIGFRSILEEMENRSQREKLLNEGIHLKVYEVGDGCVITGAWSDGSATLLWNGKDHIDINIFIHESVNHNMNAGLFFGDAFMKKISSVVLTARDEHPRGFGRVVNFKADLQSNPHWIS